MQYKFHTLLSYSTHPISLITTILARVVVASYDPQNDTVCRVNPSTLAPYNYSVQLHILDLMGLPDVSSPIVPYTGSDLTIETSKGGRHLIRMVWWRKGGIADFNDQALVIPTCVCYYYLW